MGKKIKAAIILAAIFWVCEHCRADDSRSKAIELGAQYLRNVHKPEQSYSGGSYKIGSACLCGLALLESGVPDTDTAIKNIVDYVRANAIRQSRTYEISLTIMFLDRLAHPKDRAVLQYLAVQLMSGQCAGGEWGYTCPFEPTEVEATRLAKALYDEGHLRNKDSIGKDRPKNDVAPDVKLHPEVVRLIRAVESAIAMGTVINGNGDHSNTQFAVLALWIARKHGVPCNSALARIEKQFRAGQMKDGGWGYYQGEPNADNSSNPTTAPMTCSGLVALAVGRGVGLHALRIKSPTSPKGAEIADATNDRAAQAALRYIENAIAKSDRGIELPTGGPENRGKLVDNLYFLWSLERVAMIYDLELIGKLDWYKWGSEHLIKSQAADGSWGQSNYTGANAEINTAFALLFLNRANLAKDLTATLRGTAKSKINLPDPVKVDPKQANPGANDADAEANRLCIELLKANAANRPRLLEKLRDTKGSVYTEALVRAIAKLQGEPQREAREALALRLKRMTALTLREMLKDENREIRNAAAWACGLKDDKQFVADLIAVLNDAESLVVQSARNSLRSLSGKDFGPQSDANVEDKAKAIADWKAWLAAQPK